METFYLILLGFLIGITLASLPSLVTAIQECKRNKVQKAASNEPKFEVGDILMKHYCYNDPFQQDNCLVIIDKKLGDNGDYYYQWRYCNKDGNSEGFSAYSDRATYLDSECVKVGHQE